MEMLGVGDLHFDCSVSQYLKTTHLHDLIVNEIQVVLNYAKRHGIKTVAFYGDIAHSPTLSPESLLAFMNLLQNNPEINFLIMSGNHDVADSGHNSLRVLKHVATSWLRHVKVITAPRLVRVQGKLVNVLPWPHHDTREDALNILHTEVKGAFWDSGRDTGSKLRIPRSHFSVIGHIHTAQVVGNCHFSGTLYQTNFSEKLPKFFHHITYDEETQSAELIPHNPALTLHNIIIKKSSDLEKIPDDPLALCKIFVKKGVDIDPNELTNRPNVVKFNSFQNKQELEVLINEDLFIADESSAVAFDYRDMLLEWMSESKVSKDLSTRSLKLFDNLFNSKKTHEHDS